MFLIVSNKDDLTVDYFISQIEHLNKEFFRLNTENFLIDYIFQFSYSESINKWHIKNKKNQKQISNENITGIWYRRPKLPKLLNKDKLNSLNIALMIEARNYYDDFLKTISTNWVSHPDALRKAENKILQIEAAKKIGFHIPSTLITNSSKSAQLFYYNSKNICAKPLRNGSYSHENKHYVIYNRIVKEKDKANLHLVENYPVLFQDYIDKLYEIRVVVIDDSVFAIKIESQEKDRTSEDWRVDNCHKVKYKKFSLPRLIKQKCIDLVKYFDLSFSSMDLVFSKDEKFYFLDLNPNGQWGWLDIELNLGISTKLCNFLERGKV